MNVYICVFLCCVILCRYRPCVGLIPRPRSHTKCPLIRKVQKLNSESDQAVSGLYFEG
jgi:hypothetical protein